MAEPSLVHDDDLPPVVVEIRELIGLDAAMKFVRAFGGWPLYIPEKFDPRNEIVAVVGHENAVRLMQRFKLERIYVPKCHTALNVARNIEISRRYENGTTVQRLAHDYDLSTRQIWSILKRPETVRESPQSDLFSGD